MSWECEQCGSRNSDYVVGCDCGGKAPEKVQPKSNSPIELAKVGL